MKRIIELFGYPSLDSGDQSRDARASFYCPFLESLCRKPNNNPGIHPQVDGPLGVCSVSSESMPNRATVICPHRYAEKNRALLRELAAQLLHPWQSLPVRVFGAWGGEDAIVLLGSGELREIALFGQARLDWTAVAVVGGRVEGYAGIEVQTIDTTNSYQAQRRALLLGESPIPPSNHGLNWENVNKRIVPQLLLKGSILSSLKDDGSLGLGFLVDANVLAKINSRLAAPLMADPEGDLLIHAVGLSAGVQDGGQYSVQLEESLRSSVAQLQSKFESAGGVHEPLRAILEERLGL